MHIDYVSSEILQNIKCRNDGVGEDYCRKNFIASIRIFLFWQVCYHSASCSIAFTLWWSRARVYFRISPNEARACLHLRQWLSVYVSCSDKLVEEAVGATSVAQIFEDYSESFFRDNEVWQCVGVDCSLPVIQREIKSLCTL